MMIDPQHLAILRAVHQTGSVTAAAARLNLSQSAASHAIAKLEARYQLQVWRKVGRGLQLAQAGEFLLDLAERILPELDHAERVLTDLAQGQRGILRLGMECHPCEKWLMRVTRPYLAAWPDVALDVKTAFRFDGVAALRAHEIDILVTPDPINLAELIFMPVFDYELKLVLPKTHPLTVKAHVEPADLASETLYTVPVSPDRLDIFTRFLLPAGQRPAHHIGIESIELMLQLVSAGRGIAVLPDWLIAEMGQGQNLAALRIGRRGLHKSIHLGLRKRDTDLGYLRGFCDIARGEGG